MAFLICKSRWLLQSICVINDTLINYTIFIVLHLWPASSKIRKSLLVLLQRSCSIYVIISVRVGVCTYTLCANTYSWSFLKICCCVLWSSEVLMVINVVISIILTMILARLGGSCFSLGTLVVFIGVCVRGLLCGLDNIIILYVLLIRFMNRGLQMFIQWF